MKMPVHAAGMRKEPPCVMCQVARSKALKTLVLTISVPIPRGLPPKAIRADSPPEDPPEVVLRFKGFTVLPKVLLTDSA